MTTGPETEAPQQASLVLVRRLLRHYDPFAPFVGFDASRKTLRRRLQRVAPVSVFAEWKSGWTHEQHLGRVRYLMEQGWDAPIELDTIWFRYTPGPTTVVDGHHRLMAAVFRGDRTILASFSGPVETLLWLEGKRRTDPTGE